MTSLELDIMGDVTGYHPYETARVLGGCIKISGDDVDALHRELAHMANRPSPDNKETYEVTHNYAKTKMYFQFWDGVLTVGPQIQKCRMGTPIP